MTTARGIPLFYIISVVVPLLKAVTAQDVGDKMPILVAPENVNESTDNHILGLKKAAFIGLIVGLALCVMVALCLLLFRLRRSKRRGIVGPEQDIEKKEHKLLPARELLFPSQFSVSQHKTVLNTKNLETSVWDKKVEIERRTRARVPKTRKTWFAALRPSTHIEQEPKESKKQSGREEWKAERARKTTSWFAAFKKSGGDEEADIGEIPKPAAAYSPGQPINTDAGNANTMAVEAAKRAFLQGLEVRDARKPKVQTSVDQQSKQQHQEVAPTNPTQKGPSFKITLGSGLERIDEPVKGQPMNEHDTEAEVIANNVKKSHKGNIVPPSTKVSLEQKKNNRSSWNPTIARRETIRAQNREILLAERRSIRLSKADGEKELAGGDVGRGEMAGRRSVVPPLKRQSLWGGSAGMIEIDLDRSAKY